MKIYTQGTNTSSSPRETFGNRDGAVFFLVLMVLAALSVVGGGVFLVTKTDLHITANYKSGTEAFNQADAGVQFVKGQIDADLEAGTLTLASPVENVNYTPPSGFTFDPVTQLTQTSNTNAYLFEVTGRSGEGEFTVEAVVHRRRSMEFGLFGNAQADLKAYGNVYSYRSDELSNPTPGDSTGEADSASNEEFITHMGTVIDGVLALGDDTTGNIADWHSTGTPVISGDAGEPVGRIDPDPLGAGGGNLATEFTTYSTANDNGSASPAIPGNNRINLGNGDVLTLTTGNYYLDSVILKNGSELVIDASAGPVTIYLEGGFEAKNGSDINTTGNPTDFSLYSNSSDSIIMKNSSEFRGLIYAPDAFVEVKNSADFYGVVWGETVELKNSGDVYIDVSLLNRFWDDAVYLSSWKSIRK